MLGNPKLSLSESVVAITGTTRGIGRALAMALSHEHANLVLHGRDPDALAEVAGDARAAGARTITTVAGDLRDETLGARLAAAAPGRLDVLILNAAMLGPMAPIVDAPISEFELVMRINVDDQVRLVQAALPLMSQQRSGAIIWMSSGLGRFGLPDYGAYCASKHALEGLMKVAAAEHESDGIVNVAVGPGMVQTDMLRATLRGGDMSVYQTPEDTAEGFVRLLAEGTPELNAQSIDITDWMV